VTACASVPANANGLQVLAAVTAVRSTPEGMVCGVGGYPASGCGGQFPVSTVTATGSGGTGENPKPSSAVPAWLPMAAGVLVIIGLAGVAVAVSRRRNG
jgi:hypothetical protein